MTVPRTPDTSAHAVLKIAGLLGYEGAAQVAGRKPACIRDWTNEATTSCPTWAQAVALDAAYHDAGGESAPLFDAYAAALNISISERSTCRRELAVELADASRECGEAIGATALLTQPGHSDNDTLRALTEIDQAEGHLARLKRRARSFLSSGAGPDKPGGAHK